MTRYLKIYWTLLKLNLTNLLIYRSNFISSCVASLLWGGLLVVSFFLLTLRTKFVNSWSRDELMLLAGSYSIVITLFHMLFARNFERFSQIINRGELDLMLLKPVNSQFLISFWLFHFANIIRLIFGLFFVGYMIIKMQLAITLLNLVGAVVLMIFSLTLLYAMWFVIATSTIWFTTLTNLSELLYSVTGLARFPKEIYRELAVYVFAFILPLSLVVATPTKALIGKVLGGDVWLLLGFAVGLFLLSRAFWRFALRFYTSAN